MVHCTKGIGIWDWASNDDGAEPDVVMASAGDILTAGSSGGDRDTAGEFAAAEDPVRECGGFVPICSRIRNIPTD